MCQPDTVRGEEHIVEAKHLACCLYQYQLNSLEDSYVSPQDNFVVHKYLCFGFLEPEIMVFLCLTEEDSTIL